MILGLSTPVFTAIHVAISLIAIATGFLFFFGLMRGRFYPRLNLIFLITTALTSITGYFFPNTTITPGIIFGDMSLFVLAVAAFALYVRKLTGHFRGIYIVNAGAALYFNTFVLGAQTFKHTPALMAYQNSPVFLSVQVVVLLFFIAVITFALRAFKTAAAA